MPLRASDNLERAQAEKLHATFEKKGNGQARFIRKARSPGFSLRQTTFSQFEPEDDDSSDAGAACDESS
jgi:hypothetical protein